MTDDELRDQSAEELNVDADSLPADLACWLRLKLLEARLEGIEEALKIADRYSYAAEDGYPKPDVISTANAIRHHIADLKRQRRGEEMSAPLNERRAEFVYEGARLAAIAANAPIVPLPWKEREEDFRSQFLKVIETQCSDQRLTSPEQLHSNWMQAYFSMGWAHGEKYDRENRVHPDLVPCAQLGQLERDKDAVFVALCEIARQWIRAAD